MKFLWLNLGTVLASSLLLTACQSPQQSIAPSTPTASDTVSNTDTVVRASAPTLPTALRSAHLTADGFGAIQIGMTLEAATQAAGTPLVALNGGRPDLQASCSYVKLQGGSDGLDFMLNEGRIVRVDVRSQVSREVNNQPVAVNLSEEVSQFTTAAGAKVGDREAQITALYPNIEIAPHKYDPAGHYLTIPTAAGSNNRLIFETNGDRVTSIRAGQMPQVDLVERCG